MAAQARLGEAEIRGELIGRNVAGVYPSGGRWSEDFNTDGSTRYREPARGIAVPGRWRLAADLFCFDYPRELSGGCFVVVKASPNCYEVYTVENAPAPGEAPAPADGPRRWNGRMWRLDLPATCEEFAGS